MDLATQERKVNNEVSHGYPISEIFDSPQGEGLYSGTMMTFIRLAGCTVGKPYPKTMYQDPKVKPVCCGHCDVDMGHLVMCNICGNPCPLGNQQTLFPIYTERCTLYDGRQFPCDTDYRKKERMSLESLLRRIPSYMKHVCITGGEPLMHESVVTLMTFLIDSDKEIHVETSGTIEVFMPRETWVTVSPKFGVLHSMITRANELKFLVDEKFNPEEPFEVYPSHKLMYMADLAKVKPVYLHPVNGEHKVNARNMQLCLEWQRKYTDFRVGPQLHKAMGDIIREIIR